jgi:hypothetical protein
MPNTAVRIYSTGVLSSNGEFDEVTFNPNAANSAIVNKAVFSENPSGAGWTGYNRTVTPNFTSAPDGSVTASRIIESTDSVNTIHGFGQGQSLYIAGQRYTISFYMKPSSANRAFIFGVGSDVVGGTNQYVYAYCDPDLGTITNSLTYAPAAQTTSVTNAGNGWYRFSLSFLVANTTTSGVDIQFQGGAGKNQQTYIGNGSSVLFWGLQIEQGNTPSIYQGINAASTLITPRFAKKEAMGGLYLKGEYDEVTYNASSNVQVNLVSHSQDFTQGSQWTAISGLTVTTPGFRAPDGTPTAQLLTGNGVTTGYLNTTFPWRVGNNYTFSCYFKSGTLSVVTIYLYGSYFGTTGTGGTGCDFNLANGTATPFGGAIPIIQNVGDGWYRCSVTAPAYIDRPVGDFGCQAIRMSSATGTVYAWGYQIEQSSTPSIYVRTGASGAIVNTFRQRITSNGNNYVIGSYDERSGIPVSEGLIVYLDASLAPSYNGSGTNWTGISSNKANASITSSSGGVTTSYGFNKAFDTITLNDGNLIDGQIRITGVDFNTLAQSNNFTVMFAAKKDYYGSSGNLVGNSELFQAVNNGYGTGWRITEESQGSLGRPFTGTHAWALSMSPAATPAGWGLGVSDTSTNRMCIVAFSVSPTTVYGFCNGNTTTTTNPGTYAGSTSRGWISFTGAGAGSFNGQIGFFMVYNRALSLVEMTQNYNAFRRRYNL